MLVGAVVAAIWICAAVGGALLLSVNRKVSCVLLLGAMLVARLSMIAVVAYPGGDAAFYPALASSVLKGHGLWLTPLPGGAAGWFDVQAMYPPLYPLLLAGAGSVFGLNVPAYTGLNIALDLCSAATLWLIGKQFKREDVGLVAAWLFLLYPTLITWTPFAQKESLAIVFCCQLLLGFARRSAAHVGIAAGLLALTQPALAPLAGCLGLGLAAAWGWKPMLRFGALAAGVAALVMAPWWTRNYLLFGTFIPFTTAFGLSLKVAVEGSYNSLPPALLLLPEPQRFAAAGHAAWSVIKSDPAGFVAGRLSNAFRMLTREPRPELTPCYWAYVVAAVTGWAKGAPRLLKLATIAVLADLLVFTEWLEFGVRHRVYLVVPVSLLAAWWLANDARLVALAERLRFSRSPHASHDSAPLGGA